MIRALAALVVVVGLAAGCGGGEGSIRVLAAASLTDVLPAVDRSPEYGFGGSAELATQIREGATADVYVSADPDLARALVEEGVLGEVASFGANRIVIVLPADNPAMIRTAEDLLRPGVRLVVAQEGVPVGDYARESLRSLGLDGALTNVVSEERDTRSVLGKVTLGEADAGLVYATDVAATGGEVDAVPLPDGAQPRIRYAVGVVRDGPEARGFVAALTGPEGARALHDAGFMGR